MAVVAIIGRPNVGKSTLFNRITRSRKAIVDDLPGVTRDRLYEHTEWENKRFLLVDTAGIVSDTGANPSIEKEIQEQVRFAIEEASVIIFLSDVRTGLHPQDKEIIKELRKLNKPLFLAVNKVDNPKYELMLSEFYETGVENIYPISATHGYGVDELMDSVVASLQDQDETFGKTDDDSVRIAVVGRPNVGKSTLVNRLAGTPRVVVSEIPGTTRDSVDVEIRTPNKRYIFVDTAGIRRKGRVREKIEKISIIKALESIERADLAVLLIDATEGPSDQDLHIGGYIQKRYRACIIGVNKWDLVQKDRSYTKFLMDDVKRRFKFLSFAPIIAMSAETGKNINKIFPAVGSIYKQYKTRIGTGLLNRTFQQILNKHHPPQRGGRELKFYYITQPSIKPPTFVIFCNRPDDVHFSYERYLTNQLRKSFSLDKTPIRLIFRGRKETENER